LTPDLLFIQSPIVSTPMNRCAALLVSMLLLPLSGTYAQITIGNTEADTTTILTGLDTPWEILWGPDDHIWITEREGKVSRLNPETGAHDVLLSIQEVYQQSESGLLGMALHPDFDNSPHVFLVYNYLDDSNFRERLVRYTYQDGNLVSPVTLIEDILAWGNHNGSRLVIDEELKLFMTTGDAATPPYAQDSTHLNGKVLRLNLDGSVPADNPIPGSPVWSMGHRNAQGLVLAPSGILYSSEHGPSNDDEVNIIEKGRNYGWPNVEGFCDDPTETAFCEENNVFEPIAAWTPTLAVSGLDYYGNDRIPAWNHHLLMTSLKAGRLTALELHEDGHSVVDQTDYFIGWFGRLRDLCVAPDGRVFLAVSNRDGRGNPLPADDRIVEIKPLTDTSFCHEFLEESICPGGSVMFGGNEYTERGTYTDTVYNETCDTVYVLTLNIHRTSGTGLPGTVELAANETVTLTADEGFISYSWNGGEPSAVRTFELSGPALGEGSHMVTLTVTDDNGCSVIDTVQVEVSGPIGLAPPEETTLKVYPNPSVDGSFTLEYRSSDDALLVVYNQTGNEILRRTLSPGADRKRLVIPDIPGIYLVGLHTEGRVTFVRLAVQ